MPVTYRRNADGNLVAPDGTIKVVTAVKQLSPQAVPTPTEFPAMKSDKPSKAPVKAQGSWAKGVSTIKAAIDKVEANPVAEKRAKQQAWLAKQRAANRV